MLVPSYNSSDNRVDRLYTICCRPTRRQWSLLKMMLGPVYTAAHLRLRWRTKKGQGNFFN